MDPPTQRRPSPNTMPAPAAIWIVPWKYRAEAVAGISDPCRSTVSNETDALPTASRCAPPGWTEFAQPLPGRPALPHGQATPEPSPEQYGVPVGPPTRKVIVNEPGPGGQPSALPIWSRYCAPPTVGHVIVLWKPQPLSSHKVVEAVGQPLPT